MQTPPQPPPPDSPTFALYGVLEEAMRFLNAELFGGRLTPILLVLQRKARYLGYFSFERWTDARGHRIHEIAINPSFLATSNLLSLCQVMAHELTHQRQFEQGRPSRRSYHNAEFSRMMEEIGLITSTTGFPGGQRTGERMSDYVIYGGPFHLAARQLATADFLLPWVDRYATPTWPTRLYRYDGTAVDLDAQQGPRPADDGPGLSGGGEALQDAPRPAESRTDGEAERPRALDPDTLLTRPLRETRPEPTGSGEGGGGLDIIVVDGPRRRASASSKTRYTCPTCKANIWGKPQLRVICGDCGQAFRAARGDETAAN